MQIKFPGVQTILVVFSLLGLCLFYSNDFASDPGVGWHLKAGEYILQNWNVPYRDFLLAGPERPWIAEQWLADLFIFFLYSKFSWIGVYSFLSAVFILTYFCGVYSKSKAVSGSAIIATIVSLIVFKTGSVHFIARPLIFSFPILIAMYFRLWDINSRKVVTLKDYAILAALMILWVNVHPSFIIFFVVILFLILSIFLDHILYTESINWKYFKQLILLALVISAASAINPYGFVPHFNAFNYSVSSYSLQLYGEWLQPNMTSWIGRLLKVALILLILPLLARRRQAFAISSFEILILGYFYFSSLNHVRIVPYFGIFLCPTLSNVLAQFKFWNIWGQSNFFSKFAEAFANIERREQAAFKPQYVTYLLAIALLSLPFLKISFLERLEPSWDYYPYNAVTYLKKISGSEIVVLNNVNWGGFISWYGESKVKALIDDRTSVVGEDLYQQIDLELQPEGDWQAISRSLNADYLLLDIKSNFAQYLLCAAKERIEYRDDIALIVRGFK